MKSLRNSKKGVSPIIATLLLIVIAVAAGVVTYSFVVGFIGSSTSQSGPTGTLSVDTYSFNATNDLTVYVRNAGSKAVTFDAVYLDGVKYTTTGAGVAGTWNATTYSLSAGAVTDLNVFNVSNPTSSHTLKIVCSDGTQLEFSVRKT